MPLPPIMAGVGGLLGAISSQVEANRLAKQVDQQRKQIEDSANNMRALEAKEGAAAQMAYNWAATMIRKNRDRPEALATIGQGLNQNLSSGSDRVSQYRLAASNIMAQRPARINPSGAWLNGLVSGASSGFGLGTSLEAIKSTNDQELSLPEQKKILKIINGLAPIKKGQ